MELASAKLLDSNLRTGESSYFPEGPGISRRGPVAPAKKSGHPHRGAPTLGDIVDWFKTMTTNDYIRGIKQHGWRPFPGKLWQRNYYEHIIRDDTEAGRIRQYIANNPMQWLDDGENPANKGKKKRLP